MNEVEKIQKKINSYAISLKKKNLVEKFLKSEEKYLFGRNEHSRYLCSKLKIDYVVDDFIPEGELFASAKVINSKSLPEDAIVVNCVMSIYPQTVLNNLKNKNIKNILNFADLTYCYPDRFEFPSFVINMRKEFFRNSDGFQELFDAVADKISKETLNDVLLYRLTAQPEFLKDYEIKLKEQYFENFLNLGEGEIFVDCGGFDGDTSEEFIKRCSSYRKIFFFEPSKINIEKAKIRLKNHGNIEFIQKGVSSKQETLKLNSHCGSASNISSEGNEQIDVVKIDDYVNMPYTFMKMDLEGWEMYALKGAQNSIRKYTPKLAISVYHNAEDFCNIFKFIKKINSDYSLYLRHYTQGWSETVLFGVMEK